LNWWNRTNQVLDFESDETALPEDVAKLAEARVQARLAKDFRKSDELRDKLNALGWEARDTKDGQKITRRAGAYQMFAPAQFLNLEHTATRIVRRPELCLECAQTNRELFAISFETGVLGELVGRPFISSNVFVGRGTIVEQRCGPERTGLDRRELPDPQRLLCPRELRRQNDVCHGILGAHQDTIATTKFSRT